MTIEFYFDFSCPYAYLGSTQIARVAADSGAQLSYKPMLLGGVFRAVGTGQNMSEGMGAAKAANNYRDMHRFAELWQVPLSVPAQHPFRTVRALRALLSIPQERWPAVIESIYQEYWVRNRDVSDPDVVESALSAAGESAECIERALAANDDDAIKRELRERTDEAIARGVFGAPAMFVGDEGRMFWGQDRLHMVTAAARGWVPGKTRVPKDVPRGAAAAVPQPETTQDEPATIDFWYDFSSPFAYLGSTQIESVAKAAGATLRWRPILLGALFKSVGTPNVPMLAFSAAKQRYYANDLENFARFHEIPYKFTTRFPMRTVTALRLALIAGDKIAPLSHALFRALWVEDRDISDRSVLADILAEVDLPATLLDRTSDPEVKRSLFTANEAAESAGVFGAPTCIVTRGDQNPLLFWGQDRLDLVERAARGWHPKAG